MVRFAAVLSSSMASIRSGDMTQLNRLNAQALPTPSQLCDFRFTFGDFSIQQSSELGVLIKCNTELFLQISLHLLAARFLHVELVAKAVDLSFHLVMTGSESHLQRTCERYGNVQICLSDVHL